MTLTILKSHAWRPDPEVEQRTKANSEVTTRQMTPEERAKYSGLKQKTDSNGNPIKKPFKYRTQEEKEHRERMVEMARKGKWDHVTKEFIETEFAKGRTATQIEKQLGMPKSGIYGLMKKYGIVSPHGLKSKVKKEIAPGESAELKSLASEIVELNRQLGEAKGYRKDFEVAMHRLGVEQEENEQLKQTVERLKKELEAAKGYADTAQICKVDQVQEGNHIVIKIPIGKVVVNG